MTLLLAVMAGAAVGFAVGVTREWLADRRARAARLAAGLEAVRQREAARARLERMGRP